MEMEMKKKIA
jgi:Phosphatidylinositol 3- and 4-kinase